MTDEQNRFDTIVYMDEKNKQAIYEAAGHWKIPQDDVKARVKSMMSVWDPRIFSSPYQTHVQPTF